MSDKPLLFDTREKAIEYAMGQAALSSRKLYDAEWFLDALEEVGYVVLRADVVQAASGLSGALAEQRRHVPNEETIRAFRDSASTAVNLEDLGL